MHGSQLGLLYGVLNGQQLPGLLPRLMIVSSSGSNVENVSGIAGGDVDCDNFHKNRGKVSNSILPCWLAMNSCIFNFVEIIAFIGCKAEVSPCVKEVEWSR